MKIKGLMEVILYVQEMKKMIQFYRDVIGLTITEKINDQNLDELYWVTFQTGECKLALHGGGCGSKGPDAPKFVFNVDNVPEVRSDLILKGVQMGEIRSPAPGVKVCDGKDPEGNNFSIESIEAVY